MSVYLVNLGIMIANPISVNCNNDNPNYGNSILLVQQHDTTDDTELSTLAHIVPHNDNNTINNKPDNDVALLSYNSSISKYCTDCPFT